MLSVALIYSTYCPSGSEGKSPKGRELPPPPASWSPPDEFAAPREVPARLELLYMRELRLGHHGVRTSSTCFIVKWVEKDGDGDGAGRVMGSDCSSVGLGRVHHTLCIQSPS